MLVFPTNLLVNPNATPSNPTVAFSDVIFLCHFNGANNSTSFIDEKGNTIRRVSLEEKISTAQFKYGGASGFFAAITSDALEITFAPSLNILSGNFTIETWFRPSVVTNSRPIIAQWSEAGQRGFILRTNGTGLEFLFGAASESTPILSGGTLAANTWHHIAVTRNGSLFTLWFNGVSVSTYTSSATRSALTTDLSIGDYYNSGDTIGAVPFTIDGYLDDMRISKVFAYITAFTPPPAQFPDS